MEENVVIRAIGSEVSVTNAQTLHLPEEETLKS